MKKWTITVTTIGAVLGAMALAVTASANHGTSSTMLSGKDSGKALLTEKGDSGRFDFDAVEKADGGGRIELSTFEKKDGG